MWERLSKLGKAPFGVAGRRSFGSLFYRPERHPDLAAPFFRSSSQPVALARVLLAVGNLLVVYLDPSVPSSLAPGVLVATYGSILMMLAVAVWIWRQQSSPRTPAATPLTPDAIPHLATVLDVLFTALLVASTGGHASPFYMWNVFTIVGCAMQHGWAAAVRSCLVQIALYVAICLPHLHQPNFVLGVFLVRTSFLFVIALVLAYMGQRLLEQNRMLAGLHTAAIQMGAGRSPEALLGRIADCLTDLLQAERVVVALSPKRGQPVRLALVDMDRDQGEQLLQLVAHSLSRAPEDALPGGIMSTDVARDLGAGAGVRALSGVHNLLATPLYGSRGRCGIMIACNHPGGRGFTAALQELAALLGVQAGALLETALLQEQRHYHAGVDERRRIAGELHDRLIQTLASLDLRLLACQESKGEGTSEGEGPGEWLAHELPTLKQLTEEALAEARGAVSELAPVRLREGGLGIYLEDCLRTFRERVPVPVACSITLMDPHVPEPTALLLISLLREGLNNIRKHARATQVSLTITQAADGIAFRLTDDGAGFAPGQGPLLDNPSRHYGLPYLRERIGSLGGELQVMSRLGEGTTLAARVPLLTEERLVTLVS